MPKYAVVCVVVVKDFLSSFLHHILCVKLSETGKRNKQRWWKNKFQILYVLFLYDFVCLLKLARLQTSANLAVFVHICLCRSTRICRYVNGNSDCFWDHDFFNGYRHNTLYQQSSVCYWRWWKRYICNFEGAFISFFILDWWKLGGNPISSN